MNTIKRDVYVLRNTIKIPIEVTKGTDMLGLEFAVRDYEIPATAAAVAYVYHKSMDKAKGTLCDVDNSVISFTPSGDFFAVGMNELQIRVVNDGKSLISFKETIKCSDTMGFPDDEEEKQKTLVEQLLTKVGKEEGDRKTADDTEREERIAADDAEKKARIAEGNARAEADEAIRANRIVTLDEIDLVTEEGFFVDALAVKELNSKLYETYIDPSTKSICIRFPENRIQICAGTIRAYASLQQNGTGYTGVSAKIEQSTFPKPFKYLRGCTITQNSDDWVMILGKTTTLNGISQLRLGYFAAYTNKAFYMDYIAIGTY